MIPNNTQENLSIGTSVGVPPMPSLNTPVTLQPTLYDYLALIPVLITSATPLILALKGKTPPNQNKE
jgi:hypothetical protein